MPSSRTSLRTAVRNEPEACLAKHLRFRECRPVVCKHQAYVGISITLISGIRGLTDEVLVHTGCGPAHTRTKASRDERGGRTSTIDAPFHRTPAPNDWEQLDTSGLEGDHHPLPDGALHAAVAFFSKTWMVPPCRGRCRVRGVMIREGDLSLAPKTRIAPLP